jgi:hypothetical protein
MVGAAASKMFEGWLFILLRRPVSALPIHILRHLATTFWQSHLGVSSTLQYDIGDRIHVSDIDTETRYVARD